VDCAERRLSGADLGLGLDEGREAAAAAGEQVERGRLADQPATLVCVVRREQPLERDVDEVRIAVEGLAVGERELGAFDGHVDELRRRERRQIEAGEQRELLQHGWPLTPRPRLADGRAAVVDGHRRLERRAPGREVVAGEQAAVRRTEAVDRLRDEASVEELSRALDLGLARAAGRVGDDPAVGGAERRVPELAARSGRRQVELGGSRPVTQQRLDPLDRCRDSGHDRVTALGVADGVLEHVGEAHRPELAQ
jgi:hypothetical protein